MIPRIQAATTRIQVTFGTRVCEAYLDWSTWLVGFSFGPGLVFFVHVGPLIIDTYPARRRR